MNTAPDSSAGNNPGDSSRALLESGRQRVQQGSLLLDSPWECCWVPTEGSGVLHLISEVVAREQERQEHPEAAGSASHQDPVLKLKCHWDPLAGVTWMSHVQPPHPLPRNVPPLCGSSMGNPGGAAWPSVDGSRRDGSKTLPRLQRPTGKGSGPTASLQGHTQHSQVVLIHPGSPASPQQDSASSQIQHIPLRAGTRLGKGEVNPCPESCSSQAVLPPGNGEILEPNFRVSRPPGGHCCSRNLPTAVGHTAPCKPQGLSPGIEFPPPLLKITHIL